MELFLTLFAIFIINTITTVLNSLRIVFTVKGSMKPLYIIAIIDAILFAVSTKMLVGTDGWLVIIVFVVGKILGTWLSAKLEDKYAEVDLDVTIMAKHDKAIKIADYLRSLDYTVNTYETHGKGGEEKWDVRVFVAKNDFEFMKSALDRKGFRNLSMVIHSVNRVTEKIHTTHDEN